MSPKGFFLSTGVLFTLLFRHSLSDLWTAWFSTGDNSYAALVPLATGYLVWRQREKLQLLEPRPSYSGAIALLVSLSLYFLGILGGIEVVKRAAIIATANSLVLAYCGGRIYKKLSFPLLFLFMAVPVPITVSGSLTLPLQLFSTTSTFALLTSVGIPVQQSGNILTLSSGALEVAEACSGLRSSISLLTLGILLSYLWLRHPARRMLLVSLAIPAALMANIFRIFATATTVYWFGPRLATGVFHEAWGFLTFFLGLGVFQLTAKYLMKQEMYAFRQQSI